MAVSVSKIAVQVTGDTAQLNAAMTQGARSINTLTAAQTQVAAQTARTTSAAGNSQQAITQLIFAVDDAATSFGNRGWAGAIQAASNNLTMVAALSGNLAVLIGTVAVTAVAQLTARYLEQNKAMKEQIDLLGQLRERQSRLSEELELQQRLGKASEQRGVLGDLVFNRNRPGGPGAGFLAGADMAKERERIMRDMEAMQAELEQARLAAQISAQDVADIQQKINEGLVGDVDVEEFIKQLDELERIAKADKTRLGFLESINKALREQLEFVERLAKVAPKVTGAFGAAGAGVFTEDMRRRLEAARENVADAERRAAEREAFRPSIAQLFSQLPSASTFGSVGAISAINASIGGSRNAASAPEERTAKATEGVQRATERMKQILESKVDAFAVIQVP